jgi:hypothetical protein
VAAAAAFMRLDWEVVISFIFAGLVLVHAGLALEMPTIESPSGWRATFKSPAQEKLPKSTSSNDRSLKSRDAQ